MIRIGDLLNIGKDDETSLVGDTGGYGGTIQDVDLDLIDNLDHEEILPDLKNADKSEDLYMKI